MIGNGFNIRVYGLLIDQASILVSDEFRLGVKMTKFPGGGLRYGEGTRDCLIRECMEELGQKVRVLDHFYTTDYFQPTRLLPVQMQLISFYYFISAKKPYHFKVSSTKFNFPGLVEGAQSFRWVDLKQLSSREMTLQIDKKVVRLLKADHLMSKDL
jgi:8-oxo-dGTP pyrophosphatase MutT (NUDIX family)